MSRRRQRCRCVGISSISAVRLLLSLPHFSFSALAFPALSDLPPFADGLLALSLSPVDFRYDYQRHVWLAFADRHLRDDARRKMAGARFPGGKMKLFYTSGEDWAAKTGESESSFAISLLLRLGCGSEEC